MITLVGVVRSTRELLSIEEALHISGHAIYTGAPDRGPDRGPGSAGSGESSAAGAPGRSRLAVLQRAIEQLLYKLDEAVHEARMTREFMLSFMQVLID